MRYLWDTNILIYYLQQQLPAHAEDFIDRILIEHPPFVSAISEIELLSWNTETPGDLTKVREFLQVCTIVELEKSVKEQTAEIRRLYKPKLPDAIIAASAITNNLVLLTRNVKDFEKIKDLELLNPFQKQ